DAVGQVLPRAADALHYRLPAKLSFRADFAGHARHFRGERAELIHHGIDGVLELQDFAAHVDGDLAREIAARDGGSHFGAVDPLGLHVARPIFHAVGQVLPRAAHALHFGLPAKFSFRTDFAGHARHFGRERAELIHHSVDGVFELQDLAADVDRNLAREIAA